MTLVFDFGGVLFNGLPTELLARTLPQRVPDALAPIPESLALMARLRADSRAAGRAMFYLSNMPAPYADHLERSHRFLQDFDGGVFSARVKLIKPEPEIFALAAERCSSATPRRPRLNCAPRAGGRRDVSLMPA